CSMVRRARRLALSRGLGHADVRHAARGRPAYRGNDDATAHEIDPRSGARPDLRRDPRLQLRKSWQPAAGIFRSDRPCAPKPDWKPGTDTIADIRPGSFLERNYEERQRKPDDLEAQGGQRPIAIHALEHLAHSDTGIVMLRRLLREQLQRVEQGLDPINIMRDPKANKRIPTG